MIQSPVEQPEAKNNILPMDNFYIRHGMAIGMTAITLLMILIGTLFAIQGQMVDHAKNWVVHTYEVTRHIQVLSNKFKDAELGQRGYMLTGDDRYLEPYNDAVKEDIEADFQIDPLVQHHSISQEITVVKQLTKDNPIQQKYIPQLENAATELLQYWESTINLRRANSAEIQKTDPLHGKQMMDDLRRIIKGMTTEENRLLAIRANDDEESSIRNKWIIFSSLALFYIGLTASFWFGTRHWQRARKAEAEVYARALEVAEANRELQATNEQLSEFSQELQRSEEELKAQQEELESSNEEMEEKNKALEEQYGKIQKQTDELERHKRTLEETMKQLEASSKYKSEFLANMSHELRTPLNSLLILARSLASNEDGNLTPEQVEEAHVIHNGGLELLSLINDILDLSKVEAGKLSVIPNDVSPSDIAKRMEHQFEPIATQATKVLFKVKIADDLPQSIFTDSQRVEQILKNLLANAFKFTDHGSVTLAVQRMSAGLSSQRFENGQSIAFSVIDTGIGIDESKLRDIFEAFQQEDGSTDRHYGGTGLGLTIARKFAHMLGGEIQVTSKKGEGSTFSLILPLAMAHTGEETLPEVATIVPAPRMELKEMPRTMPMGEFIPDDRNNINPKDKILLIIEDDADFAGVLIKIARKRGYKCLAAGDGKTGMLLASEKNVSAIILDLGLPDVDGLGVLDQLKHDLRTRHIPVHIMTGRAEESDIASLRKGAVGYLTKPVQQEDIDGAFSKIESLLQSTIKNILVVEDDENTQAAIESLLKKKDIHITCIKNGEQALLQTKNIHFDCIILDLTLQDMNGFEWLKRLENQTDQIDQPPVIVYTAKDLTEDENRLLNQYTGSIVIKGANSSERLLDEVTLFLHSVESTLTKDQQAMIRMQHNPDRALHDRTVLLVDDDMRNTFALSKFLKKRGMKIVLADNGKMALEKLEEDKSIEIVIMDIMMPIMDGYEAIREIRSRMEFKALPIIALTARAMPEEQERCIAAGANDYLTKPVDIERLLTLMRVWLFRQEKAA